MMEKIKVSDNFTLDEFCPKDVYEKIKDNPERIYDYLDKRIVTLAQWIRTRTGQSVMVNNWANGGSLDERCVRMPNTTTGASKSKHKFVVGDDGKILRKCIAIDITIGKMNGKEMYDWAKENMTALHGLGVRCIEHYSLTPQWLHIDLRELPQANEIIIVDLTSVKTTWKIW